MEYQRNDPIIFWGAKGQAKVLADCLRHENLYLIALFDNDIHCQSPFSDIPIYYRTVGFEGWISGLQQKEISIYFSVAIGGSRGKDRVEIHEYLESFGLLPRTIIHPTAFVASKTQLGAGTQVLATSAVCVEVTTGRSCIINTGATVDHECTLEDGVHICPGAHLAGGVTVGKNTMIGTGAILMPNVTIGESVIIGAGTVVLDDVPCGVTVVGNPGRIIS